MVCAFELSVGAFDVVANEAVCAVANEPAFEHGMVARGGCGSVAAAAAEAVLADLSGGFLLAWCSADERAVVKVWFYFVDGDEAASSCWSCFFAAPRISLTRKATRSANSWL